MTEFPGLEDLEFDDTKETVYKNINSFSEIEILPNTIVLCDIDDTLIHHPYLNHDWITLIINLFTAKHFYVNGEYNATKGEIMADAYFETILKDIPVKHTDQEGFFNQCVKAKKWMFITARLPSTVDFTRDNLKSIGVDPDEFEVRFSGYKKKGEYIRSELGEELKLYEHVVFIDDQPRNLENVYSLVLHPSLQLYKFDHIKEDPHTYYPFPNL
jgi:hypothetical protein